MLGRNEGEYSYIHANINNLRKKNHDKRTISMANMKWFFFSLSLFQSMIYV